MFIDTISNLYKYVFHIFFLISFSNFNKICTFLNIFLKILNFSRNPYNKLTKPFHIYVYIKYSIKKILSIYL